MMTGKPELPEGSAVRAQHIRDHPFWREALLPHQFAHELDGSAPVSPALNQDVENLAFLIDGAPQIHPFARDPDTISSRCHRSLGRGRTCRSRRAIIGPNFSTQLRTLS
jgi:hypothetical protein